MKIVLIGASGFVGTRLLDLLNGSTEYELKNIDLLPSHFFNEITEIGDVRDVEQMKQKLNGADVVVLLAAQHRDDVTPTSLYYDTNVGGMKSTLEAMEYNGIKRLVFFSSVAVYGLNKQNPNDKRNNSKQLDKVRKKAAKLRKRKGLDPIGKNPFASENNKELNNQLALAMMRNGKGYGK